MIRSRLGNAALTLLGLSLGAYALISWFVLLKEEGLQFIHFTYDNIVLLVIFALGLWCITGAVRNMRLAQDAAESLSRRDRPTYKYAKWNLILLAATLLGTGASYLAGIAALFWVCYYALIVCFLSMFFILIAHQFLRGKTVAAKGQPVGRQRPSG